jgi:hypothetical protein
VIDNGIGSKDESLAVVGDVSSDWLRPVLVTPMAGPDGGLWRWEIVLGGFFIVSMRRVTATDRWVYR